MSKHFDSSIPLINSALVNFFLPREGDFDSQTDELRARLNILATLALCAWAPLGALMYAWSGGMTIAWILIATTVLTCIPLCAIRLTGRYQTVAHFICGTSTLNLCWIASKTGGMSSPAVTWLLFPVVFAYVLVGKQAAKIWFLICGLVLGGVLAAESFDVFEPARLSPENQDALMAFAIVALAGLLLQLVLVDARIQEWTERNLYRAQNRALEATRQGFRTLIENSPDAILIHRDDVIQYANPAAAKSLGFEKPDELKDRSVGAFIRRHIERVSMNLKTTGEFKTGEEMVFDKNGDELPVELTQFDAAYDGEVSRITFLRDLSARRELRAQLMRMDRMAAVGTLAAGVGHEINNPLAFVLGNLHVLRAELDAVDDDGAVTLDVADMRAAMQDAFEGAERIQDIVSDLRTYSRAGDGPERVLTDVASSIESAIKMAHNEIRHRATLVRDIADVPPVEARKSSLGQVLLNLLINAAHAIEEGRADEDTITVSAHLVEGWVEVAVSDTGPGIEPERRSRIFDPFYTTKSPNTGTGLGLAVCQNIIDEIGGEIRLDSTLGEGSTFTVRLPSAQKQRGDDAETCTAKDERYRPRT